MYIYILIYVYIYKCIYILIYFYNRPLLVHLFTLHHRQPSAGSNCMSTATLLRQTAECCVQQSALL